MDDAHSRISSNATEGQPEKKNRKKKELLTNKADMEGNLDAKANPQYQDSFFRMLFKEPRYRKALYLILHSEDQKVADSE